MTPEELQRRFERFKSVDKVASRKVLEASQRAVADNPTANVTSSISQTEKGVKIRSTGILGYSSNTTLVRAQSAEVRKRLEGEAPRIAKETLSEVMK